MNFKFYPKESKLYDFLKFPELLFYNENEEDDGNFGELIDDTPMAKEYKIFVERIRDQLAPFENEIKIFYPKYLYRKYGFIDLIFRKYNIFEYDEQRYLEMLSNMEGNEINNAIVYGILSNDDYDGSYEQMHKKAELISQNKADVVTLIKGLALDDSLKWNLFLMIDDPVNYMKRFVKLMYKILPIFESNYLPYDTKIKDYGLYLSGFLNKNGVSGLDNISYSMVDSNILDPRENNILISLVEAFVIRIMTVTRENYIVWGIYIEEAFQIMKDINEDKLIERIQIFKNLGDKTRYQVLRLVANGETSTKNIAEELGVSSATISYHLNNLTTSRIIRLDKNQDKYSYIVDYKLLEDVIEGLKEDLQFSRV